MNNKREKNKDKKGSPSTTFTDSTSFTTDKNSVKNAHEKSRWFGSKSGAGFTLVETIIATAVLLLSITGPLTIATRSLTSAAFAKDQVIAFYLAQEATEFIRNKRDNNALSGNSWIAGLSECIGQSCVIDATKDVDDEDAFRSCAGSCQNLKMSNDGLYGYGNLWSDTKFTREISITSINSVEINIDISIEWESGPLSKEFTIRENILNWQGNS